MVVKKLTFTQTKPQSSQVLFTLLATNLQELISATFPPPTPLHFQTLSTYKWNHMTVTVPGSLSATCDTVSSEDLLRTLFMNVPHTGYPTPGDTSIEGADVKIQRLYFSPPNYNL